MPPLDKAIEVSLYIKKKQLFLDGNKRTEVIFANHIIIKHAAGLIVIQIELSDVYKNAIENLSKGEVRFKNNFY